MLNQLSMFLICGLLTVPTFAAEQDRVLFKFDRADASRAWRTVNDGVMGGRSSGQFRINRFKNMEFYGNLSLQNNGGFASVRATGSNLAMSSTDTIVLRVRGDGRRYNLNLYTRQNLSGYSYRQSFQTTKDEWIEVRLPVSQFGATWRGRQFPNERLNPGAVKGMGILLGDKKPGPFKLEVEWIKLARN